MAAFSSAGQLRRRPAPVNTSRRRARSGLCISSEIDICRSSQPAPNIILYARRRKVHPDDANPGANREVIQKVVLRRWRWDRRLGGCITPEETNHECHRQRAVIVEEPT